jgi:hypothetical protein
MYRRVAVIAVFGVGGTVAVVVILGVTVDSVAAGVHDIAERVGSAGVDVWIAGRAVQGIDVSITVEVVALIGGATAHQTCGSNE